LIWLAKVRDHTGRTTRSPIRWRVPHGRAWSKPEGGWPEGQVGKYLGNTVRPGRSARGSAKSSVAKTAASRSRCYGTKSRRVIMGDAAHDAVVPGIGMLVPLLRHEIVQPPLIHTVHDSYWAVWLPPARRGST